MRGLDINITGSTLLNLTGGLVIATGSIAQVTNTTFQSCQSAQGGAVHVGIAANVTISSCSFLDNAAQISGAALFADTSSNTTIVGSYFACNALASGNVHVPPVEGPGAVAETNSVLDSRCPGWIPQRDVSV